MTPISHHDNFCIGPDCEVPAQYIISVEDVEKQLTSIKTRKAIGPDGIPNWLLQSAKVIMMGNWGNILCDPLECIVYQLCKFLVITVTEGIAHSLEAINFLFSSCDVINCFPPLFTVLHFCHFWLEEVLFQGFSESVYLVMVLPQMDKITKFISYPWLVIRVNLNNFVGEVFIHYSFQYWLEDCEFIVSSCQFVDWGPVYLFYTSQELCSVFVTLVPLLDIRYGWLDCVGCARCTYRV